MVSDYRRTPLPERTRTPLGWLAACLALLAFSPFIGFAVHGRVGEAGLVTGLAFALLPLAGLAVLALQRWRAWRGLPPPLREEWTVGRLVPAEGAPAVTAPLRFSAGKQWLEFRADGLLIARDTVLSTPGLPRSLEAAWVTEQAGQRFVPWPDIAEWIVETDSEGPDYHRLRMRFRGELRLRRFQPEAGTECDVLDAVRGVGGVAVRLRCDVGCD